ncbi:hypothetical protein EG328_000153 [Venturia inaequalis]|uniref:NADH dehydrogenase [ubiquinone] 1 beta subcomplex subunit 9 n=1 Tax=Venturia inaequalis TaxID=5025 RepID=A0A8H3ZCD8_VENIN|nr:hypothetical protein EG328_000153 [Venturia inaequalis]
MWDQEKYRHRQTAIDNVTHLLLIFPFYPWFGAELLASLSQRQEAVEHLRTSQLICRNTLNRYRTTTVNPTRNLTHHIGRRLWRQLSDHGPPGESVVRPPPTPTTPTSKILTLHSSLYRRALKLTLDWSVHRHIWRGQAMYIRSLFEAQKNVREPRQQKALIEETEALLEKWKHPDPYRPPTAPGGSKYERNLPAPILDPPPPMHL